MIQGQIDGARAHFDPNLHSPFHLGLSRTTSIPAGKKLFVQYSLLWIASMAALGSNRSLSTIARPAMLLDTGRR